MEKREKKEGKKEQEIQEKWGTTTKYKIHVTEMLDKEPKNYLKSMWEFPKINHTKPQIKLYATAN